VLRALSTKPAVPDLAGIQETSRGTWLKRYRLELMVAIALTAIWFSVLQYRTLLEPDEGRYAEIPREMLVQNDWVVPHLDGMQYLEKPPLQYWATAAAYRVLGVQPWVSRLWSVCLGWLGIGLVYSIGRSLFSREAAFCAALLLASSPLYVFIAQINVLDMGLAFFLTAAMGCLLAAQRTAISPSQRKHRMWGSWVALACAFLQKGLVAFVLPGLAVAAYALLERDASLLKRLHWRSGLLIVALLDLPWLIAMSVRNPQFPAFFFIHEHFARFATTVHGRAQPAWFFLAVLVVGVFPWLPVISTGIRRNWTDHGEFRSGRFLIVWALAILVFFSLSGSKLAPYIVSMMAPLALLGGHELMRRGAQQRMASLIGFPLILAALCLLATPSVITWFTPGPRQDAALQSAQYAALAGDVIIVAVLCACALPRMARVSSSVRLAVPVLSVGLCAALMVLTAGTNTLEAMAGGPTIAASLRPYLRERTPFYCVGMYPQTVTFALARTCTLVAYHGELMPQYDDSHHNWIGSLQEFGRQWRLQPGAVAIVDPAFERLLVGTGLPEVILARTTKAVTILQSQ
jgi:4-amino-4-deoxy-L-arabinose transferase-like glycosyltransferase